MSYDSNGSSTVTTEGELKIFGLRSFHIGQMLSGDAFRLNNLTSSTVRRLPNKIFARTISSVGSVMVTEFVRN